MSYLVGHSKLVAWIWTRMIQDYNFLITFFRKSFIAGTILICIRLFKSRLLWKKFHFWLPRTELNQFRAYPSFYSTFHTFLCFRIRVSISKHKFNFLKHETDFLARAPRKTNFSNQLTWMQMYFVSLALPVSRPFSH